MVDNVYGAIDGTTATPGPQTVVHYYDKAGVKAANEINVYGQFADRRSMPLHMGKTYKVSKWLHIYDRKLDPDSQVGGTDADFATKGYLSSRSITDVSTGLPTLAEGAGAVNKVTLKKVTIETAYARYGEMLDYTDDITMFSEDMVQVQYREELGKLANRRSEDLIQLDMLDSTTIQFVGTSSAIAEVGQDTDAVDGTDDDLSRVSYDMIRKITKRLVRNRAEKNTTIVSGSTKIDTRVINKAYYAIIGPEVKYDLETVIKGTVALNGQTEYAYVPAFRYAAATNLAEGEVGSMNDVRFIESESAVVYAGAGDLATAWRNDDALLDTDVRYTTEAAAIAGDTATAATLVAYAGDLAHSIGALSGAEGATNFDVFPILFPTKGSFATVGLKGNGKIKFNSQAPTKIELANPYGNQGFFSYNMWYAGIILREERLLKGYVCASA
jgi:N4-gp56 family major capsid protein